jgi:cytoskeletal protein CcmA (bactofilin family)
MLSLGSSVLPFNPGNTIQLNGTINTNTTFENSLNSYNAFQIQNSSGTNIFNVDTSTGCVTIGVNNVNATTATCTGGEKLYVSGTAFASGGFSTNATPDISEVITTSPDVGAYDVVSAGPDGQVDAVRSTTAYDPTAIGVISDGTSAYKIDSNGMDGMYLVLAGRVPVHVTNENGPIEPGDYLTTSDIPGYAMKATQAGPTIGKALAAFDDSSGTVMVQTNLSYYTPMEMSGSTSQSNFDNITVSGNTSLNNVQASGNAEFSNDLTVNGNTSLNITTINGSASISNDLNISGSTTTDSLNVTSDLDVSEDVSIGGSVDIGKDLNVVGSINTSSIFIKGDTTFGGHLITASGEPTANVLVNAGIDATVVINGNDTTGTITITTGNSPSDGPLTDIIFSKLYGTAPHIVLSPSNSNASAIHYFKGTTTQSDFMLNTSDIPTANTTYVFDYLIAQ